MYVCHKHSLPHLFGSSEYATLEEGLAAAAHSAELKPGDSLRLRAGSKIKRSLLAPHAECEVGKCKLMPGPDYTHVFTVVEIEQPAYATTLPAVLTARLATVATVAGLGKEAAASGSRSGPRSAKGADASEGAEEEEDNNVVEEGGVDGSKKGKKGKKGKKAKKRKPAAPTNLLLWGWAPRSLDWSAPDNEEHVICRAQHKLSEAFATSKILANFAGSEAAAAGHALDVGASPGGWTACLAANCMHVVAVDTGALHEDVLKLPNVTHIPVLLPVVAVDVDVDAGAAPAVVESLPADGSSSSSKDALAKIIALAPPGGFSIVTCDINAGPADAIEIVMRAKKFMAPKALLVRMSTQVLSFWCMCVP